MTETQQTILAAMDALILESIQNARKYGSIGHASMADQYLCTAEKARNEKQELINSFKTLDQRHPYR